MTATALAVTNGPTTSPEAIGLYANGTLSVANTPDQTTVGSNSTTNVNAGVLTAGVLTVDVVSNNYSWASAANISALTGLTGDPITGITATAVSAYCVTAGTGDFSESYVNLVGLTINGVSPASASPAANTVLINTAALTVTLNQQVANAGPTPPAGSETVNAVNIDLNLLGIDIVLASATCGPYTAGQATPLASGKGFGIGLGAVGLLGGGYAVVYVRRRRNALSAI
jgi:hypothetical protein